MAIYSLPEMLGLWKCLARMTRQYLGIASRFLSHGSTLLHFIPDNNERILAKKSTGSQFNYRYTCRSNLDSRNLNTKTQCGRESG